MKSEGDSKKDYERFGNLTYADFQKMAKDPNLSCFEKIGFPNSFRENKEALIFNDVRNKLSLLNSTNQTVLDIGPGCSELPLMLIELCEQQNHQLILIDSQEMLDKLPNGPFIQKIPAFYPNSCLDFISAFNHKIDVILTYSVLHYIFAETNLYHFLDVTLSLLNHQGQLLIGDIPNVSKRKRFLSSETGRKYHKQNYDPLTEPTIKHLNIESGQIDDAVIFGMLMRARQAGYDAYVIPQSNDLPMANRREDLLIIKP